ncbi:tail fiber domain-containing protein [candidate division KSB1 bacterium]|nr:tail fiber domain-containing protein [candidate division KSB1 bacterium]
MLKKSFITALFFLLFSVIALAQVPNLINYQGRLTDSSGNPLSDTLTIQFKIYKDANTFPGEIALWTETQFITLFDGLFSVLLGSVVPIPYDVFDGSVRYLSITLRADPEMAPRKALVSVGYAYHAYDADKLDGQDASSFLNTSDDFGRSGVASDLYEDATTLTDKYVNEGQANAISTAMIKDNAVTSAKITPDFVSSVDGVKNDGGNIDLVAGSNITINPDDANNKITISASTSSGDNLGNHTASQNIKLNNKWLSNDGGNEGIKVDNSGKVETNNDLIVGDDITATDDITADGTVTGNCTSGNYGVYGKKGGNFGYLGSDVHGVYGYSGSNNAVWGNSPNGHGIHGYSSNGFAGYFWGKVYMKGKVGIGTDSPDVQLVVRSSGYTDGMQVIANDGSRMFRVRESSDGSAGIYVCNAAGVSKVVISGNGNVGIINTSPTHLLDVGTTGAYCNGGAWVNGSSRKYKENISQLALPEAMETLTHLAPVKFNYKTDLTEKHVGFIAEDVPELVSTSDRKGLSPMDIVAVLTKVAQEQQKIIKNLAKRVEELENK